MCQVRVLSFYKRFAAYLTPQIVSNDTVIAFNYQGLNASGGFPSFFEIAAEYVLSRSPSMLAHIYCWATALLFGQIRLTCIVWAFPLRYSL